MISKTCRALSGTKHISVFYMLAFLWTFGLCCGIYIAFNAELNFDSWMCALSFGSVSIPSLLFVMLFPFLISFVAIRYQLMPVLYLIALLKSFIYGFCRCLMMQVFLSGGWLVNIFLFFSDTFTNILLLLYWTYCIQSNSQQRMYQTLLFSSGVIALCFLDYCVIAPLLTDILA